MITTKETDFKQFKICFEKVIKLKFINQKHKLTLQEEKPSSKMNNHT